MARCIIRKVLSSADAWTVGYSVDRTLLIKEICILYSAPYKRLKCFRSKIMYTYMYFARMYLRGMSSLYGCIQQAAVGPQGSGGTLNLDIVQGSKLKAPVSIES